MADNTVQTSESDRGKDNDPPPGGTSTPMLSSRHILAPETPDHGGKADSSKEEDERKSHQVLQVPKLTVGGKMIKTAKGKESRSITSDTSSQGSTTSRTRGDAKQIAERKPLEAKVSKKLEKKGAGRGRAPPEECASIVVRAEVSKLNKEAKAAKLAADKAERENAGKSKHSETERYIDLQADKSGHIIPQVALDPNPPGGGDSSDQESNSDKETEDNSVLDSVSTTSSQKEEYKTYKSFLTKRNLKLL
jgi:hypothetical protein